MVIKKGISEGIRGAIPECETPVEYLEKVEIQYIGSPKAYGSSLIKRLIFEKYTGEGVRDHILKMRNVATRLKPLDLAYQRLFFDLSDLQLNPEGIQNLRGELQLHE
jgi:hypothetical protein